MLYEDLLYCETHRSYIQPNAHNCKIRSHALSSSDRGCDMPKVECLSVSMPVSLCSPLCVWKLFLMARISVLQGEIFVSSMTCLGKNTANIWIHQARVIDDESAATNQFMEYSKYAFISVLFPQTRVRHNPRGVLESKKIGEATIYESGLASQ